MNSSTRDILIGIGIVIVIGLLLLIVWHEDQTTKVRVTTATSTASISSSQTATSSNGSTVTVSNTGTSTSGYTVTQISSPSGPAAQVAPNYKTPLTFAADFSDTDESQDESSFLNVQSTLTSNPTDYNSWLELGTLRQETGNYGGAIADWKYVTELYPTDPTAYANLGYLYWIYLKEPAQAVTNYKEAIKLDPTQEATFYMNLAKVYQSEGDSADAKAVLQQGISAQVSGYQNLQTQLNSIQ